MQFAIFKEGQVLLLEISFDSFGREREKYQQIQQSFFVEHIDNRVNRWAVIFLFHQGYDKQ